MAIESKWLNIRVDPDEHAEAEKLLESLKKSVPILTRAQLLRAALREGLAVLRKKPRRALLGAGLGGGGAAAVTHAE